MKYTFGITLLDPITQETPYSEVTELMAFHFSQLSKGRIGIIHAYPGNDEMPEEVNSEFKGWSWISEAKVEFTEFDIDDNGKQYIQATAFYRSIPMAERVFILPIDENGVMTLQFEGGITFAKETRELFGYQAFLTSLIYHEIKEYMIEANSANLEEERMMKSW